MGVEPIGRAQGSSTSLPAPTDLSSQQFHPKIAVDQICTVSVSEERQSRLHAPSNGYRRDIDGLRAIAITSVVLYHASNALIPSGYVGVDIFFVISGYLIGGIIHREVSEGRFTFSGFYARRARRILPALTVVLLATLAAGVLFYSALELRELAIETTSALLAVSNFKFWLINNYFAPNAERLPLLMTWSLGVEEQFYFVFPWLLVVLSKAPESWRFPVLITLTVASFMLSTLVTPSHPQFAFYLLPTRAWELGVGALLAIGAGSRLLTVLDHSNSWREAIGWIGLALVGGSIVLFDNQTPFPGYAAAFPVIGTALLIAAKDSTVNGRLLSSAPFVGIGLVSYSWYLWHWPMMALVRASTGSPPTTTVMLITAALSLGAGTLCWRFVERPFRKAETGATGTLSRFGGVLAATLILPVFIFLGQGLPWRLSPAAQQADAQRRAIGGSCLLDFGQTSLRNSATCMPADGPSKAIVLMGDSHAQALAPGLQRFVAQDGYRLLQLLKAACLPLDGVTTGDVLRPLQASECADFLRLAKQRVIEDPLIDTVVLAGAWPASDDPRLRAFGQDGSVGALLPPETGLRDGLGAMIAALRNAGKRVILVGDVPHFGAFDPLLYSFAMTIPARRGLNRLTESEAMPQDFVPVSRLDQRFGAAQAIVRNFAVSQGLGYIDIADQFCSEQGCRYAADNVPLFNDTSHLSQLGSARLNWECVIGPKDCNRTSTRGAHPHENAAGR